MKENARNADDISCVPPYRRVGRDNRSMQLMNRTTMHLASTPSHLAPGSRLNVNIPGGALDWTYFVKGRFDTTETW